MGISKIIPILILLLIVISSGCISQEKPEEKMTREEIDQIIGSTISSFDKDDPDTLNSVEDLVALGPGSIPSLLDTVEKEDVDSKWAAIYALSRIGYGQDQQTRAAINDKLKQEFDNEAISIRVMAGGVVTIFGDKEGIPVLIEGLHYNQVLMNTEPPEMICGYASRVLRHYTRQDFGYQCNYDGVDDVAIEEWEDWWAANDDSITWDDTAKEYVVL